MINSDYNKEKIPTQTTATANGYDEKMIEIVITKTKRKINQNIQPNKIKLNIV